MSVWRSAAKSIAFIIPPVRHLYQELLAANADRATLNQAVSTLTSELAVRSSENAELRVVRDSQEAEIGSLRGQIGAREQIISTLAVDKTQVSNLVADLKRLTRIVEGRLAIALKVDAMIKTAPNPQNDINVFAGEWMSAVPIPGVTSGHNPLFEGSKDGRVSWVNSVLGGLKGMTILELGPYEGGQTYQLDKVFGAASITAIEANPRAFLRCLIVKNLFEMDNSHFLLGDFSKYLAGVEKTYDLIFASGTLYHMTEPSQFLKAVSTRAKRVFLWTHYYDEDIVSRHANLNFRFEPSRHRRRDFEGHSFKEYCFIYRDGTQITDHLGGTEDYAYWLELPDILTILRRLGFTRIETGLIQTENPFGPNACIVAEK